MDGGKSIYGAPVNLVSPYQMSEIRDGKVNALDIMYLPDDY